VQVASAVASDEEKDDSAKEKKRSQQVIRQLTVAQLINEVTFDQPFPAPRPPHSFLVTHFI
jgi:hypothetical protein